MLNNFTRICLDAYTAQMLVQKSLDEKEQKQLLTRAIQGQAYPAATTIKGYAVLLDRAGLDRIAPPVRPDRALWTEGYARAEQLIAEMRAKSQRTTLPARPVVSASVQASQTVSASVPGAIIYPATVQSQNGKIGWLLSQGYTYRQIERELSVSHATISKVSVALQARRNGAN